MRQQAVTVLARRQAIVIGPTPPGTGVIAPATSAQKRNPHPQQACSALWLINAVDANVDHGCTRFDPIAWYHFGATNGCHNNIRAAHDRWQILGP